MTRPEIQNPTEADARRHRAPVTDCMHDEAMRFDSIFAASAATHRGSSVISTKARPT